MGEQKINQIDDTKLQPFARNKGKRPEAGRKDGPPCTSMIKDHEQAAKTIK